MSNWPMLPNALLRCEPSQAPSPSDVQATGDDGKQNARRTETRPLKVLVVGQTPPPYHGQAVMIERLLDSRLDDVRLYHVRMAFSRSISDLGKVQFGKLLHLFTVILNIYYARLRHGVSILYYPPSGPNVVPVMKDVAILLCTRWMFRRTIFHIHAGGTSQVYSRLNRWQRWLFRRAFFEPDAVIRMSTLTPEDGAALHARREFLVPNGIPDAFGDRSDGQHNQNERNAAAASEGPALRLLYVGVLNESKGVLDLVEACALLKSRGVPFHLELVGQCCSEAFRRQLESRIQQSDLVDDVHQAGVLTGDAKFDRFANADVFCFPSFYECEAFPLVLLEALSFELPVVATRWRGIPSIIQDGETGLLIEPHCPGELADRLQKLANSPELYRRLSVRARQRFLREYTQDVFARRMESVFHEVARCP